jgi:hypothetical protein
VVEKGKKVIIDNLKGEVKPVILHDARGGDGWPDHFDPWDAAGEDFLGIHFDFSIIGTSAEDESAYPHVLSPPLMHSLQEHLPFSKRGESFWLKYSLVRDGASTAAFLQNLRGARYTVMSMETLEGEVFGAFTSAPWHIDHGVFGTGESFLWRMKSSRAKTSDSVVEQARMESEIEVFKYSFENKAIQLCQSNRIAVGGGGSSTPRQIGGSTIMPNQWGFGIAFEGDIMMQGTSSPCITFNSPSLSKIHSDGTRFELLNLEVWGLTPCLSIKEAELMECRQLFLERNTLIRHNTI